MEIKSIITRYFWMAALILLCLMGIGIWKLYSHNKDLEKKLLISVSNEKAYMSENTSLTEENRLFKYTIEQLNYSTDSIVEDLNEVRKELNIKDKNLKSLEYIKSIAAKEDTVIFRDTIFRDCLNKDTLLRNEWYQLELSLNYPDTIIVSPMFTSEKYIIASYSKETVNPPKKFWLWRLFQKKHKVVKVNVVEKNPYISNKQEKFIEVIDD